MKKILITTVLGEAFYKSRRELIFDFIDKGYEVILVAPEKDNFTQKWFYTNKVKYYQVNFDRTGTSIIHDLKIIPQLRKIIKIEKPDITYAFGGAKAAIYTVIASKLENTTKIYCMINGLGSIFRGRGVKNKIIRVIMSVLFKYSLSLSNGVLFQNKDDLNEFVNKKLVDKSKCIIVNGSGVNLSKYPYTGLTNKNVFLFVGRLLKDKGIYEFVNAAKIIKAKYPQTEFWVVGGYDSNPSAVKENEIKKWCELGIIKYFGKQENTYQYYHDCSVFVLPSYHEGTPRTNLEAMAVGRPIITTDAPGCRETVVDNKTGFLVPIKNEKKLADKMEYFLKNPGKISEMGFNSYEFVKEKYDVNKVNNSIMKFLLNNQ